jgi:hypothetical protein
MSVVASETSPLNCRWIIWKNRLPVCTQPPRLPHPVSEGQCSICEFWSDSDYQTPVGPAGEGSTSRPRPAPFRNEDPLNRELCPRCGSHDVVLMQRDALVQSFTCSICHQRWLATRPWPVAREPVSRTRQL